MSVSSVTIVMRPDGGLIQGGGEVQALQTAAALERSGLRTDIFTPLTTEVGDVVHFIGCQETYADTIALLRSKGIPCVTSSIWHRPRSIFRVRCDRLIKRASGTYPRRHRDLFHASNLIFTPTEAVERRLEAFFELPRGRMFRVPNAGVSTDIMDSEPDAFRQAFGIEDDFILHVGMITARKNQLGLIRAMRGTGKRVIFLGRVMDEDYARLCRSEADDRMLFLDPLSHGSPLIGSAYAAARVVCIPSFLEDFLIAGIEAAMVGAKLVLSQNWYPEELYEDFALYPDAHSPSSIRAAVEQAWGQSHEPNRQRDWFAKRYTWETVTARLRQGYERAIES
jgi:glycosyltransferase involved in cell wall biosynthesis